MSNKKENAILITIGLVMICFFFAAMFHPRLADAAFSVQSQTRNSLMRIEDARNFN